MIDIIIPAYNCGKTIARTLNSILEQVNSKDLCVYIADDCSTEDFSSIINHFSKYLNIIYLRLDKNKGPGGARNYALERSYNEYIVFIDADDEFYDNKSVLKLYKNISNYDIVFGKMMHIVNGEITISHNECCLHGKMYRRSFLNERNIRFSEKRIKGANAHDDNAFNQLYLTCANKVNKIMDTIYKWNYIPESITNKENKTKSFKCYIKNMTWLFEKIEKQKDIENHYAGIVVTAIMLYCYFNYLLYEKEYSFFFKELSYLKKMYNKYTKYTDYSDLLRIYNNFNCPAVPNLTIYEFIDKIE